MIFPRAVVKLKYFINNLNFFLVAKDDESKNGKFNTRRTDYSSSVSPSDK